MPEPTLTDVLVSNARIEESVKGLHDKIDVHLNQDEAVHKDHENRLRAVEKRIWIAAGVVGILSPLLFSVGRIAVAKMVGG